MGPIRDDDWREERLFNYLPTVQEVAARLLDGAPAGVGVDDLVDVGVMALIDAMDRHQGDERAFHAYVRLRIQAAMMDELRGAASPGATLPDLAPVWSGGPTLPADVVRNVLPLLSPREQRVAELHWLRGRPLSEVADLLGLDEDRITVLHAGICRKVGDLLGIEGAAA